VGLCARAGRPPPARRPELLPGGRALNAPVGGQVDLYCGTLALPRHDVERLRATLSVTERARAARFLDPRDGARFVVAHALVRSVLARYLGVAPAHVPLVDTPGRKPTIAGVRTLGFSLTHTPSVCVLAVAATLWVGVDAEEHRRIDDALALTAAFLAPEEFEALRGVSPERRDAAFLRLWTCKEAFVKALGVGLADGLRGIVVRDFDGVAPVLAAIDPAYGRTRDWSLRTTAAVPGCHVAVATRTPSARDDLHVREINLTDEHVVIVAQHPERQVRGHRDVDDLAGHTVIQR
jgi:4'-phosphopantetheinyl transferase